MASTNILANRNRLRLASENDTVQRGKTTVVPAGGNRQALGVVNQVNAPLLRNHKSDGSRGPVEKKPMTKTHASSNLRPTKVVEVKMSVAEASAGGEKVQAVDPSMPGQYDPFALITAPTIPTEVRDIDTADSSNPQLVSEYINEIYIYLRRLERQQSVRADYMAEYKITPRMRTILVDWLVQVHQRFHLLQETLYLTISIIDRFLQDEEVSKAKLQLVGVTAMWIASKYEEMYAPEVADFVYITDNSYSKIIIRQMERLMLKKLNFDLGRPLPLHFLRRYSKVAEVDSMRHMLAKYLLELSVLDYHLVHYHPSETSAACLCLSLKLLDDDRRDDIEVVWDETMTFYSTYSEEHLKPIMYRLALLVHKSSVSKQKAIKSKYQSSKFMRISAIDELQCALIEDYASKAGTVP